MIQLSVIIVNYKSANLIINCLKSLYRYTSEISFEIIVVDNSNENSKDVLQKFPGLKWTYMGYNAGFARANNVGISVAQGNTILLLNPDTLVIDNSITSCYKKLLHTSYVAAGVQLFDENFIPQISGNYFVKGGLNHLLPIPYWGDFVRWLGYKAKSKIPNVKEAKEVTEVDWISGAFLMVKKEAIEKAGLLDEDFFLYAEEVEWCSRLKEVGKLCIFGDLRIVHLEGATINADQNLQEKGYYNLYDKKGLQLMVSNHLRVRKQYGVAWFLLLLLNYSWGFLVYLVASSICCIVNGRNVKTEYRKVFAFGRNVISIWKLCGTIISNRPHFYKML